MAIDKNDAVGAIDTSKPMSPADRAQQYQEYLDSLDEQNQTGVNPQADELRNAPFVNQKQAADEASRLAALANNQVADKVEKDKTTDRPVKGTTSSGSSKKFSRQDQTFQLTLPEPHKK
jgi:hypothetical protein